MDDIQEDIDTLKSAIRTGARKVKFQDGREVEYRSLADMRSVLDEMQAEAGQREEPIRTTYASYSRD